jgi:hypothetical protein
VTTVIQQGHLGKRFWAIAATIAVVIVIGLGVAVVVLNQLPPCQMASTLPWRNSSNKASMEHWQ